MQNLIKPSSHFSIPAIDYAGQGNAIVGIRDAGKTYTAMKIAEDLMDAGVPIIVYDPVGVWKNLKIGTGKHKGYPVVTAGAEGCDIVLNAANAVDVVRAAMKENVNLVLDFYSPSLINKSIWIRIVQETVDLLMYENKSYGMRHIFIEEAAEFIPQRLQPQHAKVYASIERLARMGRNARLGYTIINQRAEEVNKAILEISNLSLLHKQVGKNSLLSIQKWLELLQLENTKEIIKALPGLQKGQCWVVGSGTAPHLIQVLPKKTFHPDPKQSTEIIDAAKKKVDVSAWVEKLNKALNKPVDIKEPSNVTNRSLSVKDVQQIEKLKQENEALQNQIKAQQNIIGGLEKQNKFYVGLIQNVDRILDAAETKANDIIDITNRQTTLKPPLPAPTHKSFTEHNRAFADKVYKKVADTNSKQITGGAMRMLKAAAMFYPKPVTRTRMAALAGLSYTSGSFGTYKSTLIREGLITANGQEFTATQKGLASAGEVGALPTEPAALIEMWCENVGSQSGAARMLRELGTKYPNWMTRAELGEAIGMSHTSGSFGTYISTLKRNGLIQTEGGALKAADELFK